VHCLWSSTATTVVTILGQYDGLTSTLVLVSHAAVLDGECSYFSTGLKVMQYTYYVTLHVYMPSCLHDAFHLSPS